MNKKITQLFFALFLLYGICANCQQLRFYKKMGIGDTLGTGFLFKNENGNYYLSSYKSGFIITDPRFSFLFKIEENGSIIWRKYIDANHPYYFTPTLDGVYPTSNTSKLNLTGSYFLIDTLIAYSNSGPLLLQTDTACSVMDYCYYISLGDTNLFNYKTIKTSDNGYVLLGAYAYSPAPPGWYDPFFILKTDSLFNPQWMKSYKNLDDTFVSTITATQDGGFVVGGFTKKNNIPSLLNPACFYMKTDSAGNILWLKKVYLPVSYPGSDVTCIKETPAGDLLITGYIKDTTTNYTGPIFLIKADANGNTLWEKRYTSFQGGVLRDMIIEDDGSITGSGEILLPSGNYSCLMHLDSMGNYQWGWYSYDNLSYTQIIKANDGGYMLNVQVYCGLLKTDSTGSVGCWEYVLPAPTVSTGLLFTTDTLTVEPLYPTRHSINLYIHNAPPFQDTTYCYGYTGLQDEPVKEKSKALVYPNPVGDKATIACPDGEVFFTLYDISGRKIIAEKKIASNNVLQVSTTSISKGFYNFTITSNNTLISKGNFIK